MAEFMQVGLTPDRALVCQHIVDVPMKKIGCTKAWSSWIKDETRSGHYYFHPMYAGLQGDLIRFHFSDPDVAFEFKMRWA